MGNHTAQVAFRVTQTGNAHMASQALQDMARGFLSQGAILPALKCLEALLLSSLQLPADAARIRLQVIFHIDETELSTQSTTAFLLYC